MGWSCYLATVPRKAMKAMKAMTAAKGAGGKGHDSNRRLSIRCRDHWLETECREGSWGGHGRRSSRSVVKGWLCFKIACALNLRLRKLPHLSVRASILS